MYEIGIQDAFYDDAMGCYTILAFKSAIQGNACRNIPTLS